MNPVPPSLRPALLRLAHDLGREDRRLAILGEGNVSARTGAGTFLVKASGSNLATLATTGLTACRTAPLLALLDRRRRLTDAAIDDALLAACTDRRARQPSTEAVFHAWLLSLPGVNFVGHTHPLSVNALLCSRHARAFAQRRLFPEQIVCCGEESVLVPYTDPGLALARATRAGVLAQIRRRGRLPRTILLENHGLIALGATPAAVLSATLMAEKAAAIFLGAARIGGPRFLSPAQVARIAGRPDEHYRQKALGL